AAGWEYRTSSSGSWTAGSGSSFTLAPGSYAAGQVQVRQIDLAGNTSVAASNGAAISIDQSVAAPSLALAHDTGSSASDGLSSDGTVNVGLSLDVASWEYRTSGNGSWTAGSGSSFTLAPGSYAAGEVQVRQTDLAGNTSAAGLNAAGLAILTAPAAPGMALASDTGASTSDGVSATGTVDVMLAPGARWEYRSSASGAWTAGSGSSFTLAPGSYAAGQVQVRQIDIAGNTSAVTANGTAITIDRAAPTVATILRPALENPASNQSFVIEVRYADAGAGIDAASIGTADLLISAVGAPAALAVSAASWDAASGIARYTVDAPAGGWNASHGGTWIVSLPAGGVLDLAGNALSSTTSQFFSIGFNSAPVITSNGGGDSASIDIVEGHKAVTTVKAADTDAGDTLSYSISGADAALFTIDAASGALSLRDARNAGSYQVDVTVSDMRGASDTQSLTVNLLRDADRDGAPDVDDPDLDGDGRLNSAEDPVPSAHGGARGDGNGDGIADSTQVNVASLATVGTVGADKRYATIEVAEGLSLTNVSNSAAPAGLPRNAKMPLGQFDFDIKGLAVGATVQIQMYVDKSLGVNGYYKQTANGWVNLATASIVGDKTMLSFSLTDGGEFDADGIANGVIVDPGGAAIIVPRIVSGGGEALATVAVEENTLAVTTVRAEAAGAVSYAITGGADAARFTIDAATGALRFVTAPDFEQPLDLGDGAADNTYLVEVSAVDASGSASQLLTVRVQDVDETPNDGDAVPGAVELLVPSLPGAGSARGDGNGDGRADSTQANVGSLPFLLTGKAQTDPGNAAPVYLSLVADSVEGKAPAGAAATIFTEIRQLDAPTTPDGLTLPLGQLGFKAALAQAGAAGHFSLYLDGAIPVNGYWQRDAGGNWANLASAAHGGKLVSEGGRTRLDFTIVDGGAFDADGKADGIISGLAAPGMRATPLGPDSDGDQFPDALEAAHGLSVGVKDNDVFGNNKLFVMELYRDLLFREAQAAEWGWWQGLLDSGMMDKAQLVSTFLDSAEFQGGTAALARLYLAAFERLPDGAGLAYWTGQVGSGASLATVAQDLATSAEFMASYGRLDDAGFMRQLYQNVLGREGDSAGLGFWTAQLAGGLARGEVLLGFAQSAEYRAATDHGVTAALGYLGLLDRDPTSAEIDYWTGKLDAGVPEVVVIGQFLSVPEYHDRFLP
ncbi:DUF4214 domain-containing protein, partial [Massilia sp. MS-15]|uniref:DUF4214 domain-containing protein n=1 Tax=Massilia sp. MS-15 TaxID=2878200 RepID=UPI001CD3E3E9